MKRLALIASLMLAACQPDGDGAPETEATLAAATTSLSDATPAPTGTPTASPPPASPTPSPSQSPLTADFCDEHGDDPEGPYGNRKTCYMQACEAGDQTSCELMGSYNGNLQQPGQSQ
ncbi:hypothetical protein GRI97_09130 [Altererythrobacter xixiisoli]|uniref:Lipoprotein n=1 Tax=Croceibacterium xixiisoli TaxID=1476466 RepID=A0A6I4TVD4_9SPHN|nr:hypothetical protein [Croceibacterium xixiisoli]MXO99151.1 hypothetical protein [Croceibacterium xixiisoli]